jgi:predicted MFS family arabinose efflux permease
VSLRSLPVRSPVIALLCINVFASTFSIGGFAPLLPEIGRALRLSDVELGVLAGTFAFARMATNLPVGLFVRRRLRAALVVGPVILLAGILCMATGQSLAVLLLGRALMGLGHALGMVAGLTAVLNLHAGGRLGAALNAIEFSGMLGFLGGVTLVGWLPRTVAWNAVFLVACSPVVIVLATLPLLLGALSRTPAGPTSPGALASSTPAPARRSGVVLLVFVTGAVVSCAYSTVEAFLIPLRGSRHFGLDRRGIAQLLQIAQVCDILALLPLGVLADRRGASRVLAAVTVTMAGAIALIAFGSLPLVVAGCALMGLAMAGWMLPLSVLREVTAPEHVAMRTAVYRVGVDGGLFLGPFLSGLLWAWSPALMPGLLTALLLGVGAMLAIAGPRPADAPRPTY